MSLAFFVRFAPDFCLFFSNKSVSFKFDSVKFILVNLLAKLNYAMGNGFVVSIKSKIKASMLHIRSHLSIMQMICNTRNHSTRFAANLSEPIGSKLTKISLNMKYDTIFPSSVQLKWLISPIIIIIFQLFMLFILFIADK